MHKFFGILIGAIAIIGIGLGALGLLNIAFRYAQTGVEAQQIPREAFKAAIYSLFVLLGIKGIKLSARKISS